MKRINLNNIGQNGYPLFLGEKLGLLENIHVKYPEIANLRDQEVGVHWHWTEFSMAKDALDIQNPKYAIENKLMSETLTFQMFGDKEAASVKTVLEPVITNNEVYTELSYRAWNEVIHALGYSEIVRVAYENNEEMLLNIRDNEHVLKRANFYSDEMDKTYKRIIKWVYDGEPEHEKKELKEYIARYLIILYLLEAISFKASFACTFAIKKSTGGAFSGISATVAYIARDEIIHAEIDRVMILALMKESEEWRSVFSNLKPWTIKIVNELVQHEEDWADYLFSGGRNITDLNAPLLKRYIHYSSKEVYETLGISEYCKNIDKDDPLPWVKKDFLELDNVQFASKEIQSENYKTNSIDDDNSDKIYDF